MVFWIKGAICIMFVCGKMVSPQRVIPYWHCAKVKIMNEIYKFLYDVASTNLRANVD
jgi:hypothetical protein